MSFPLDVLVEMMIDGTWTDITGDVRTDEDISITVGRRDESSKADYGKCTMKLNNREGKYSPKNPRSPYYGKIGRNTPIRVSVNTGPSYMVIPGDQNLGYVGTEDAAVLDITGSIDVRLELTADDWNASGSQELVGKYQTTSQRSWMMLLRDGTIHFEWSADGTNWIEATALADLTPVIPSNQRLALRVTMDATTGDVTFYTAPSIDGTWTQLGVMLSLGAPTSIFSSTSAIRIGNAAPWLAYPVAGGKYHRFELRDGIDGTVVANPDFTEMESHTTGFTDDAGRPWTVFLPAAIRTQHIRFAGEVSSWPIRWNLSGSDSWTTIQAAGIMRRLSQGSKPQESSLYRWTIFNEPNGYWPLTDGEYAAFGAEAFGGQPMVSTTDVTLQPLAVNWGKGELAAWMEPVLELPDGKSGRLTTQINRVDGTAWAIDYVRSTPGWSEILFIDDVGNKTDANPLIRWTVITHAPFDEVLVMAEEAGESYGNSYGFFTVDGVTQLKEPGPHHFRFQVQDSGSQSAWYIIVDGEVMGSGLINVQQQAPQKLVFQWTLREADTGTAEVGAFSLGHFTHWAGPPPNAETAYEMMMGQNGETSGDRVDRLCEEKSVPVVVIGDPGSTEKMGPQPAATFLNILREAEEADGGILCEDHQTLSLMYRARNTYYNQDPVISLDYESGVREAPDLEPVDDDQLVRNDITVNRQGGSFGQAVLEEGPLSVQDPPDGVGRYDESLTLNLYEDRQNDTAAYWRLHQGTWDEARYPVIKVDLLAAPHLIPDVLRMRIGDKIEVRNPPQWIPPGDIEQVTQGYTERLNLFAWNVAYNCTPGGVWDVGVSDSGVARVDTDGSELAVAIGTTDTTMIVSVTAGTAWTTDPADFPFDVQIGGEVMTVNSIDDPETPQVFNVVRSVNGIVKSHTVGESVSLAYPTYVAL